MTPVELGIVWERASYASWRAPGRRTLLFAFPRPSRFSSVEGSLTGVRSIFDVVLLVLFSLLIEFQNFLAIDRQTGHRVTNTWALAFTTFFIENNWGHHLAIRGLLRRRALWWQRFLCSPASRLGRRHRRHPFLLSFVQDLLEILDDLFGLLSLLQLGASPTFRGHKTVGIIPPRPPRADPRGRMRTAPPSA